jgi:hypothetical protein
MTIGVITVGLAISLIDIIDIEPIQGKQYTIPMEDRVSQSE